MYMVAVHSEERHSNVDKFNRLKSNLTGDALEAIAGYQLSNENNLVAVDVLKYRLRHLITIYHICPCY